MSADLLLTITDPRNAHKVIALPLGKFTLGSEKKNQIVLDDPTISWRHALLSNQADGLWIEDLMSHTGTYIDGSRVEKKSLVKANQRVQIGGYLLQVGNLLEAPKTVAPPPSSAPVGAPKPATTAHSAQGSPTPSPLPKTGENTTTSAPKPGMRNFEALPIYTPPTRKRTTTGGKEPAKDDPESIELQGLSKLARRKLVIKKQVQLALLDRLDLKRLTVAQIGEDDLREKAESTIGKIIDEVRSKLPAEIDATQLSKEIYDEALGLGPLEDLLDDTSVTEIMVNGPHHIYVERAGRLYQTPTTFVDADSVLAVIERIVSPIGRRIDESQPYVDARLPDGSRVNAIIPPLSLTGPCVTIRKFSKEPFTAQMLIDMGSITRESVHFIDSCVKLRKNIIVAGGTGTGKTTFLNLVSNYLPGDERIVTIEDAAELRLSQQHVIRLEARPPNIEGRGAITIRDLVRNALRMRPDRIVVGECRAGEALDMLQAMNTGHEGSLTTVHANSPRDVISRLETMVLMAGMDLPVRAIREQIAAAIHMIIHLSRFPDGTRKVSKITEVCGLEGDKITMQDLFEFKQEGFDDAHRVVGRLEPCGVVPTFLDDFRARGIHLDARIFDTQRQGTLDE